MSRPPSRRKCRYCSKFFIPDKRTVDRQKYCSEAACRKASKAASQQRWLSHDGNGDYFRGPEQVQRVQRWRQANPGYWKRNAPASKTIQPVDSQPVIPSFASVNPAAVVWRDIAFCRWTGFQPFRFFGARFPGPLAQAGMRSRLWRSEIGVVRTAVGSTEDHPIDVSLQQWVTPVSLGGRPGMSGAAPLVLGYR